PKAARVLSGEQNQRPPPLILSATIAAKLRATAVTKVIANSVVHMDRLLVDASPAGRLVQATNNVEQVGFLVCNFFWFCGGKIGAEKKISQHPRFMVRGYRVCTEPNCQKGGQAEIAVRMPGHTQ
ncbi:MAG: hypothetical protein WCD13_09145, partial [Pseudolabrys sp.]